MRDRVAPIAALLAHVAATASIGGCTSSMFGTSSCPDTPPPTEVSVSAEVACRAVLVFPQGSMYGNSNVDCATVGCSGSCTTDSAFVREVLALNDAGDAAADAGDGGAPVQCPTRSEPLKVTCATYCEGRRTDGIGEPDAPADPQAGAYFAACAWLEATAVQAFRRLHDELASHGAPDDLLARVRVAEEEEVRHTQMTSALARRFGVTPRMPPPASSSTARPLLAVAVENAVEGCIREAYGATLALVRSDRAEDPEVRAAMRAIAEDECRHAELSYALLSWMVPHLSREERSVVASAASDAVRELRSALAIGDEATRLGREVGMPSLSERGALVASLERDVYGHVYQALAA